MRVCFQFVTKGRAVINTEPEDHASMKTATEKANTWMGLKGQTLSLTTFDGGGAVVRVDEVEHIAVMAPEQMMRLYADDEQLLAAGRVEGLRAALVLARDPDADTVAGIEQALANLEGGA